MWHLLTVHLQLSDLPYLECDNCWLSIYNWVISLTLNVTFVDCPSTTEWSPLSRMWHLLTSSTTEWSPLSRMWHLLTILLQLSDLPYLECDICWLFLYNWVISLIVNVTFVDYSSTTEWLCKRTFIPVCRMSGYVHTLVYFYLALLCLFHQKEHTRVFLS